MRQDAAAVGEQHLDLVGAFDHMVVGEHIALRADDHARAQAGLDLLPRPAGRIAEEAPQYGVVEERIDALRHAFGGVDVDHGRRGARHGVGISAHAIHCPAGQSGCGGPDLHHPWTLSQPLGMQNDGDEGHRQPDGYGFQEKAQQGSGFHASKLACRRGCVKSALKIRRETGDREINRSEWPSSSSHSCIMP